MNCSRTRNTYRPMAAGGTGTRSWGPPVSGCILALLVLGPICGCTTYPEDAMAGSYYLAPHKDLRRFGRVALVELDNRSGYPEISADMTQALYLAIQKEQVFGLSVTPQNDPTWRSLQENLDSLQALQQLLTLRRMLGCDGLLIGSVTEYQPYPHTVIGLRLKLLDLADGQVAWGLEQVWDSDDRSIQRRIEAYSKDQRRSGLAPLRDELVVVSSLNFVKFVAYEVAGTLDREKDY